MLRGARRALPTLILLLVFSHLAKGLYVQPVVNVKGCEWAIFGTPSYVVLPYKGYAFIVVRDTFIDFKIYVMNLETGKIVSTVKVHGLVEYEQGPVQVLLCPAQRRLVLLGALGNDNYVVFDITNPERPALVNSVGLVK